MILFIECVVACAIFNAIITPSVMRNPLNHIMSYPKAIRTRVEGLSQYREVIHKTEQKHILMKIVTCIISVVLLACVAYLSGAHTFTGVFIHVFVIFFAVNIYDLVVMDILIFCKSKRVRIPGTEDMVKEYESPKHHMIGAIKGTVIGVVVALLSGGIVQFVMYISGKL